MYIETIRNTVTMVMRIFATPSDLQSKASCLVTLTASFGTVPIISGPRLIIWFILF